MAIEHDVTAHGGAAFGNADYDHLSSQGHSDAAINAYISSLDSSQVSNKYKGGVPSSGGGAANPWHGGNHSHASYNPNTGGGGHHGYGDPNNGIDIDVTQYGGDAFGNQDYDQLISEGYTDTEIGNWLRGTDVDVSKKYREKFGVGGGNGGGWEAYVANYGDIYDQKVNRNEDFLERTKGTGSGLYAMGGFQVSQMGENGLIWDSRKPVHSLTKNEIERYGIDVNRTDFFDTAASKDINGRTLTGGIDLEQYRRTGIILPDYVPGTLDPNAPADGGEAFWNNGGYDGNQNQLGNAYYGDYTPNAGQGNNAMGFASELDHQKASMPGAVPGLSDQDYRTNEMNIDMHVNNFLANKKDEVKHKYGI